MKQLFLAILVIAGACDSAMAGPDVGGPSAKEYEIYDAIESRLDNMSHHDMLGPHPESEAITFVAASRKLSKQQVASTFFKVKTYEAWGKHQKATQAARQTTADTGSIPRFTAADQVAANMVTQWFIVKKTGTHAEKCAQLELVVLAYLQANDRDMYASWHETKDQYHCN